MTAINLLLISGVLFSVLEFILLPRAIREMEADNSPTTIRKAGKVALLSYFRLVALVTFVTTGIIAVMFFSAQMLGGVTVAEVNNAIATVESWRNRLQGFGETWGWIVTVLLIFGMARFARQRGQVRVEKAFQRLREEELARIRKEAEAGTLEDLPPTPAMQQALDAMKERQKFLKAMMRRGEAASDKGKQVAAELTQQLENLQQYYVALDVDRRWRKTIEAEEVKLPEPRNFKERLSTFFFSRGLLNTMNAASRVLVILGLALLIPALMGIASSKTDAGLRDQLVRLTDLRFEVQKQEDARVGQNAEAEREKAEGQSAQAIAALGPANYVPSPADRAAIRSLARVVEQRAARAKVWEEPAAEFSRAFRPKAEQSDEFRRLVVRDNIVDAVASADPDRYERYSSVSDAEALKSGEKPALDALDKAIHAPRAPLSGATEERITSAFVRSQSVRDRTHAWFKSFQTQASATDFLDAALNHALGLVTDSAPPGYREFLAGVEIPGAREPAERVHAVQRARFVTDLAEGKEIETALSSISRTGANEILLTSVEREKISQTMRAIANKMEEPNVIAKRFQERLPAIEAKIERGVDLESAGKAIDQFKSAFKTISGREPPTAYLVMMTDGLADFRDIFPGQVPPTEPSSPLDPVKPDAPNPSVGDIPAPNVNAPPARDRRPSSISPRSVQHSVLERVVPSDPGKGSFSTAKTFKASAVRARSFGMLRGFSRVGGVLIGQDQPKDSTEKGDFVDLRWEKTDDSHLRLVLTENGGKEYRSIPHRTSQIYHALIYAADGRPLTVTMAKAKPLQDWGIHLHPSLVDSPLGYRIIELDRLVDRYTGKTAMRDEATRLVFDHLALYKCTWASAINAFNPGAIKNAEFASAVASLQQNALRILEGGTRFESTKERAERALKDPSLLGHSERSPLTVKTEFFDAEIVEKMRQAATASKGDLKSFLDNTKAALAPDPGFYSWWSDKVEVEQEWSKAFPIYEKKLKPYFGRIQDAPRAVQLQLTPLYTKLEGLQAKSDRLALQEGRYKSLFKRLQTEPPEFEDWSGVREKEFKPVPGEILIMEGVPRAEPFRFMLQLAFTTAPAFVESGTGNEYSDAKPWEFPHIAKPIAEKVAEGIVKDPSGKDSKLLEDTTEFAILQRLFRLGLAGGLGAKFPVEKLAILMNEIVPGNGNWTNYRTLRWHSRNGAVQAQFAVELDALDKALTEKSKTLGSKTWFKSAEAGVKVRKELLGQFFQEYKKFSKACDEKLDQPERSTAWKTSWDQLWREWHDAQAAWDQKWEKVTKLAEAASEARASSDSEQLAGAVQIAALKEAEFITALKVRRDRVVSRDDKQAFEELKGIIPVPSLD